MQIGACRCGLLQSVPREFRPEATGDARVEANSPSAFIALIGVPGASSSTSIVPDTEPARGRHAEGRVGRSD
jgi:hypothetical protein